MIKQEIHFNTEHIKNKLSFIPLHCKSKKPRQSDWPERSVSLDALSAFGSIPSEINVGPLTGAASGGLIDIDLDGPFTTEAAGLLMPPTGMVIGRDSRPASHRFYMVDGDTRTVKIQHPTTGKMLVEVRGDGCQTMMVGSIHPDDGETVRYEPDGDGEPSRVDCEALVARVGYVAAVAVMVPYWIEESRHNLALWLAGLCACRGMPIDACLDMVRALVAITGDDELVDRIRAVETTYCRVGEGKPVEWRADLLELFGSIKFVNKITEWVSGPHSKPNAPISVGLTSNANPKSVQLSPALEPGSFRLGHKRRILRR